MEPLKIWHAPVQGYAEIVDDPQVMHMKSLVTVAGAGETGAPVTLVNHPVLYDGETAEVRLPPQPLGAQTAEVLQGARVGRGRDRGARQRQGRNAAAAEVAQIAPNGHAS